MKKISLFAMLVAVAFVGCGGSSGGGGGDGGTELPGLAACAVPAGSETSGVVCGQCLAADGVTPLAGAEVLLGTPTANVAAELGTITAKGVEDPTKCVADSQGNFACLVPAGTAGTTAFYLTFEGFDDKTFNADIVAGSTTDVGDQAMTGDISAKWAVVPGAFDGVQVLLAQLKGCTLDDGSGNPFDPATMDAASARTSADCESKGLLVLSDDFTSSYYPSTFIDANGLSGYAALFVNCMADYSSATTDAALQAFSTGGGHVYFSDLSDSWLEAVFPGIITWGPASTTTGTVSGEVVDTGLAAYVGTPIDIIFDLGGWADIDSVASGVTTFIQGTISPLSTLTGTRPITVGWRPSTTSGCVFYTSYHIEGASTGSNQEKAIKYLVQNIGTVCQ